MGSLHEHQARALFLNLYEGLLENDSKKGELLYSPSFRPNILRGLANFFKQEKDYTELVLVSNEWGVSRGYYTSETLDSFEEDFLDKVRKHLPEVNVHRLYCATPSKYSTYNFNKLPQPGLALIAARRFNIDCTMSRAMGGEVTQKFANKAGITAFDTFEEFMKKYDRETTSDKS